MKDSLLRIHLVVKPINREDIDDVALIVINVPTRASLAVETKVLLFLWLAYLNNKSNVCKHISSEFGDVTSLLCRIPQAFVKMRAARAARSHFLF